jgi:sigma-54 dependent transcriptional regulator, acetoin dehydrogenase operon transcriptional activator AcoR
MPSREVDDVLAASRETLLATGSEVGGIRSDVLASWRRSMAWSVHPDSFAPLYRPAVNTESRLLRAAEPVRHLTSNSGELGSGCS